MTIEKFDAIVVGAGPAGCAAAFDLAASRRKVAILERRTFPRMKPCGGALTVKALCSLRFAIDPVIRNVATDFVAGRELTRETRFHGSDPVAVMTVREDLDSFVLKKTLEADAAFFKTSHIDSINITDEKVEVETSEGRFCARFLVGADGANSTVRRLLTGSAGQQRFGFALEGQISDASAQQPEMIFDFGVVPRGYGWVFPRGDHYNVGVYTYDSRFRLFPDQLRSYAREKFGRDVTNIAGAPIGMWGWTTNSSQPQRRVFLVGDAAGLCEPILGEGIYYAIKSGQTAAAAILEELGGGQRADKEFNRLMEAMRAELRIAGGLAMRFYRDLGIGCLALSSPLVRYALMKGYSRGVPLGDIPRKFFALPFRKPPHVSARLLSERF